MTSQALRKSSDFVATKSEQNYKRQAEVNQVINDVIYERPLTFTVRFYTIEEATKSVIKLIATKYNH